MKRTAYKWASSNFLPPAIILLLVIAGASGCAPTKQALLPSSVYSALNSPQAIADYKKTLQITDGCSSPWIVSKAASIFFVKNWGACCLQHDFDYQHGYSVGITKAMADYALWHCVSDSNHPIVANIMFDMVHLFGNKYYHKEEENGEIEPP